MKRTTTNMPEKRALLLSAFITCWVSVAFWGFQPLTFEIKDDAAMAQMIYGLHSGIFDPHLIYINVLVGYILKGLLCLFPTVAWYMVLQASVVMLSVFVLIYLFLFRLGYQKGLFTSLVFVLFFGSEFFLSMQFTKTGGLATTAGVLLLFHAIESTDKKSAVWMYMSGGVLTLLGSLYRFRSFEMVLIPLLGVGLITLFPLLAARDFKKVLQLCLPFVIVFIACFGCRFYNNWEYNRTDEWRAYQTYNTLRYNLLDFGFPEYEENETLYQSLGISFEDHEMLFLDLDNGDTEILSTDAMQQLVNAKPANTLNLEDWGKVIFYFFFGHSYSVAVLLAFIVSLYALNSKRIWLLVYLFVSTVAVQGYFTYCGRNMQNRVNVTLLAALFAVLASYGWQYSSRAYKPAVVGLALLVAVSPFTNYAPKNTDLKATRLHELVYSTPDTLYFVRCVSTLPWIPTGLDMYPVGYLKNLSVLGGWRIHTAAYNVKWDAFSITNPYRDLVDREDVMFISDGDIDQKLRYIRAHYAPNAKAHCVRISEDGYAVYRITTTDGPLLDTSKAVDANQNPTIHQTVSITAEYDSHIVRGYVYAENENSFGADIYLGVVDEHGNETLYYTTQTCLENSTDVMNGQYGSFFARLNAVDSQKSIRIYLQTDDTLYRIDTDLTFE